MCCRREAFNTTLKHLSHHGTKVCNPAQNKSAPAIRNQEATACFMSVSATNCLQVKWFLTAPKRRKSLEPSVPLLPNFKRFISYRSVMIFWSTLWVRHERILNFPSITFERRNKKYYSEVATFWFLYSLQ